MSCVTIVVYEMVQSETASTAHQVNIGHRQQWSSQTDHRVLMRDRRDKFTLFLSLKEILLKH